MVPTKTTLLLTLFLFAVAWSSHPSAAPQPNCAAYYLEPRQYNWVAFRNTCGVAITIFFKLENGGGR